MEKSPEALELKQHVIGFILAIVLTFAAYFIVVFRWFSPLITAISIGGLAVVQAFIQLFFFLDLGNEPKPRWNLMHFLFMLMVLVIIVGGSLWIMHHLNYNVMPHMFDKEHMDKHMTY